MEVPGTVCFDAKSAILGENLHKFQIWREIFILTEISVRAYSTGPGLPYPPKKIEVCSAGSAQNGAF